MDNTTKTKTKKTEEKRNQQSHNTNEDEIRLNERSSNPSKHKMNTDLEIENLPKLPYIQGSPSTAMSTKSQQNELLQTMCALN